VVALTACTGGPAATPEPELTATPLLAATSTLASVEPAPSPIPLPTLPPATLPSACKPRVTASTIVNVRNGPGTIYSITGALGAEQSAEVAGKNAQGTWWYIVFPAAADGHGWVAASVTTTDCITPSLPVIPDSSFPAPFAAAVTNVEVSVEPGEVDVPGCAGEVPRMTARATIYASGPMQVSYSFEIDGVGTTPTRTTSFHEYGSAEVVEKFRPETVEGRHWVRLQIEGVNVRGWQSQAFYRINCP